MTENDLTRKVFNIGLKIHKALGPGLLESVYQECFCIELDKEGINYKTQEKISIYYDGQKLQTYFVADLIIENKLIIELKSVKEFHEVHFAQVINYLKITKYKLGLLINFNVPLFKNGFRRVILGDLD